MYNQISGTCLPLLRYPNITPKAIPFLTTQLSAIRSGKEITFMMRKMINCQRMRHRADRDKESEGT